MPNSDDPHRLRRRALLTLLFVGLIAVMIRPSWYMLNRQVPNLGDPILYGWSWNWTRHALFTNPADLFDGNIYWRHDLTIAYTDNMLLLLAPFSFLRAVGASWALQLNTLALASLLGSLAATYALARRLTGRLDAAVFAAIAYTFGSFTLVHLGHPQLLLIGQFPLGFLLAFRWLEQRRTRDAIGFGLVNASFFFGALYYAAIWIVCVAVVIVGYLIAVRLRPGARFWRGLAIVGVFSALAIPVMIPYLELSEERPLVPEWGLQPRDLAIVTGGSYLYPGLDSWSEKSVNRGEHAFFTGFSTDVFAIVGFGALVMVTVSKRNRRHDDDSSSDRLERRFPDRRREIWLLAVAGGAAVVLALGPEVRGQTMPFTWFHDNVPGFSGIRVAARLVIPGLLAVAVFAAVGITALTRRLRPRVANIAVIGVTAFLLLELAAPYSPVTLPDDAATLAVYRALADQPSGAVAELPIQDPTEPAAWAQVEAPRMLYSTLDLHPRINGYSGSWPPEYLLRRLAFNKFPAASALRAARRLDVRYFILHEGRYLEYPQYSRAQIQHILDRLPPSATSRRYGNAWLIDLEPTGT